MFQIKKIVDLSINLENTTPFYPGDPKPDIYPAITVEKDGCMVTNLGLGSHTGTHIDAQCHFVEGGQTIEDISLDRCIGQAVVVDVSNKPCHYEICLKDIEPYMDLFESRKIVLFRTDWTKKIGTDEFWEHPYLSKEVSTLMVEKGIKLVGIDAMNVDCTTIDDTEYIDGAYPVHHILLPNNIIISENIANLDKIDFADPYVFFLPLKIVGSDGSPVRAIALDIEC